MKLAYVAGKYRGKSVYEIVQNIRAAEAVAVKYWKLGYAVICPHKNTSLMDGCTGEASDVGMSDGNIWMLGDLEMLSRCDVIVMMSNWRDSQGARTEHDYALELGIPIIYET